MLDILVYTCAYIPTIDKRKSRLRIFFNYIAVRAVLHTKFTEKNYKIKLYDGGLFKMSGQQCK